MSMPSFWIERESDVAVVVDVVVVVVGFEVGWHRRHPRGSSFSRLVMLALIQVG